MTCASGRLAERQIRKIAMEDVLTGLPNRMAFNDYLDDRNWSKRSGAATQGCCPQLRFQPFQGSE